MQATWIKSIRYEGVEVPVSTGRLTFVKGEDMWSLRVIADQPLNAPVLAHAVSVEVTTTDGQKIDLGTGRCLLATQNSRYHFTGRDPDASEDIHFDK